MDQLQQLHGELDVPQPARAELDLTVPVRLRDVLGDTTAHGLDRLHEPLALGGGPDERGDGVLVALPQLAVPRHAAGLEQRLELPGLRPALVVAHVRVQGAHQGSVLALGAQVRVHLPQGRFGARGHHGVGEHVGQLRGDLGGRALVRDLPGLRRAGLHDVHDVHVRDVVQLARAALAHADHGQAHLLHQRLVPALVRLGPGDGERRLECRSREVGELAAHRRHVLHGVQGADVAHGHTREPAPVGGAQGLLSLRAREPCHGGVGLGVRPHGLQQRAPQRLGLLRARAVLRTDVQQVEVLRCPQQELPEGLRGTEQPVHGLGIRGIAVDALRDLRVLLDEPHDQLQRDVRRRRVAQSREQRGEVHGVELSEAQPAARVGDVREPDGDQVLRGDPLGPLPRGARRVAHQAPTGCPGWCAARTGRPPGGTGPSRVACSAGSTRRPAPRAAPP